MARSRKFTITDLYQTTKDILANDGYHGFTFSILAEKLSISRGAIYKYFTNKDELITDYMVYEMNNFLKELKTINNYEGFDKQFDYLFELFFKDRDINKIIGMTTQIHNQNEKKVVENLKELQKLHHDMYNHLSEFIKLGKKEGRIKDSIHEGVILGLMFQTVAIPNHYHIPMEQWIESIKEIIKSGIIKS